MLTWITFISCLNIERRDVLFYVLFVFYLFFCQFANHFLNARQATKAAIFHVSVEKNRFLAGQAILYRSDPQICSDFVQVI